MSVLLSSADYPVDIAGVRMGVCLQALFLSLVYHMCALERYSASTQIQGTSFNQRFLSAPLDHSDSMKPECDDIEQLPRSGKPAVEEDIPSRSSSVKRLLQQTDYDRCSFFARHVLAFMR